MFTKRHLPVFLDWSVPLGVLLGLSVVFWLTDLDISFSSRYFEMGSGWTQGDEQPWAFLYHYGVIPAWIVAVTAFVILIVSLLAGRLAGCRRRCVFLVLVMIVGPGLLVNTLFKQNWGRPRPLDLVEFAGEKHYVPLLVKSSPDTGNSFASGHAATGFYLFAPYFFLRRRARCWAMFFLALGLGYGSFVGLARIIQGAHFLSDVIWAGGLVYLSGLAFQYLLHPERESTRAAS
jgi:membrane-associated PAP2 superfamily phosphatase